jgi:hypothetical protein
MVEKRVMMKFVQSCTKVDEKSSEESFKDLLDDDIINKKVSFKEFILSKKFPSSISNFLINAVAMCPSNNSYSALNVSNFMQIFKPYFIKQILDLCSITPYRDLPRPTKIRPNKFLCDNLFIRA